MKVLVTGGAGQLGRALEKIGKLVAPEIEMDFRSSSELDITNENAVQNALHLKKYSHCINCAAYTAVDKSESDSERARAVNVDGPRNLAKACADSGTVLIHISTDFVFDGKARTPYSETDETNPLGIYGLTKLEGEKAIMAHLKTYFIIRTSWLFSEFGPNFMTTMLRLASERDELSIVNDQTGTPTYAGDLACAIFKILKSESNAFGIYHYSGVGETTWYEFAKAIFDSAGSKIHVRPIPSEGYPTPAERPKYSVLDNTKISREFNVLVPNWKKSLITAYGAYLALNEHA